MSVAIDTGFPTSILYIGYLIAPIFNAAGRLEDAKQAVSLFIEEDGFECLTIIEQLLENNNERKNIQKEDFRGIPC